MTKAILKLVIIFAITHSTVANAELFWKSGKITSMLSGQLYSGCMVALDKEIGHACPSKWVSLDCKGLFDDKNKETGKKKFALALAAAQTGKTIHLLVNNLHKANGFCVAKRVQVSYR